MPLPTINNVITPYNPTTVAAALMDATCNHPPVTVNNTEFKAKCGNAAWMGNTLTISSVGATNYWFIPAIQNKVSYCVVPCGGGGDAYVISDQFGGCEYHELYNAHYNLLAFLHVYRGGGATTQYTAAAGWVLRGVKRSWRIAQAAGMSGSNLAVSCIDRAVNPPTVQSGFINIGGYPNLTVRRVDNGDAPYVPVNRPRGGPCFLTTATCLSLGLPDDCAALTTLRWFRDQELLRTAEGRREVALYYEVAPKVVEAIDRRPDREQVYRDLYENRISAAVSAVHDGRLDEARAIYLQGMLELCSWLAIDPGESAEGTGHPSSC